jgi:hypothetical protein
VEQLADESAQEAAARADGSYDASVSDASSNLQGLLGKRGRPRKWKCPDCPYLARDKWGLKRHRGSQNNRDECRVKRYQRLAQKMDEEEWQKE